MMQDGAESAEMVEKEAKRLEVLKRRQERELNQLVQYELMRKALQVSTASGAQLAANDMLCCQGATLSHQCCSLSITLVYAIPQCFPSVDEGQACLHRWPLCKAGNAPLGVVCDTPGARPSHNQGGECKHGRMMQQHHL